MISIIMTVLTVLALIGMAKARRRRRRWSPNNQVVRIQSVGLTTTLADGSIFADAIVAVADEEYRAISMTNTYAYRNGTPGEGPVHVGIAHGDYSSTEIDQWFESQAAMTRGNMIAKEQADRKIRMVGTFPGVSQDEVLNDGKPIHTKLNWHIPVGKTIVTWVSNQSGGPLTTGGGVVTTGKVFLRWGQ